MAIASTNPTTGETVKEFAALDSSQVEQKIAAADTAFRSYRRSSFTERGRWLTAVADLLEKQKPELARTMTL